MKNPAAKSSRAAARKGRLPTTISAGEVAELRERLRESQETLDALRNGEVDAVVVTGPQGSRVYSLAGADEPYRIFVERMQEGAVTVSTDGIVLYANQFSAGIVGLPLEKMIGAQLQRHIPAAAWEKIRTVVDSDDEVVKHECLVLTDQGHHLPVNLTASRLPIDGRHLICLVVTDLTLQKEGEQLRLAKEGAEEANLAKDEFLAALSHELRTPLTPVLMAAAALEQDLTLPDAARRTLSMICRNVELEARLIDDLLDLTRIRKGKLELHFAPMDWHDIIRRAVEICQADMANKKQRLRLHLDARHTQTTGDSVRLQQVLWNIIRNAIKFTPPGGLITIHTGNEADNQIWIKVSDNGAGFSAAAAPSLFNAFEQGGREITQRFGGLGLGLAISRSIIDLHDGNIRGASAGPGLGATFALELPLHHAAPKPDPALAAESSAATLPCSLRILLVEDHEDTRVGLTLLLRRARHEVTAAGSAAEALKAAAVQDFDIVISDLGLPDQSGIELMCQLRDRFQLNGIAVSGYGMDEDIRRSHAAGFEHHLTKPIRMAQLRRLLLPMRRSVSRFSPRL